MRTNKCLYLLLLTSLCLAGHASALHGQVQADPLGETLDQLGYDFFADTYRIRTDDFTKGGSSLEVMPDLNPNQDSGSGIGVFIDGFVTLSFDYQYKRNNRSDFEQLDFVYLSENASVRQTLPDTRGKWCRRSLFLNKDIRVVQWDILIDKYSGPFSTVLFDNFKIETGNKPQPERCYDADELPLPDNGSAAANILSPLLALLLDSDNDVGDLPSEAKVFGEVQLPNGVIAPAGGVEVTVSTFPIAFDFGELSVRSSSTTVVIPSGQSVVEYEFPFLISGQGTTRQIKYQCNRGCTELDLATGGFWNDDTGTTDFFGASDYDVNASVSVPILLEGADSFSGLLDFPGTEVATGEEQVVVTVREVVSGFGFPETFSFFYYPSAGDPAFEFDIGVPSDSSANGWTIDIQCSSCPATWEDVKQYVTRPAGYQLARGAASAYTFSSNTDFDNVFLELLLQD